MGLANLIGIYGNNARGELIDVKESIMWVPRRHRVIARQEKRADRTLTVFTREVLGHAMKGYA